MDLCDVAVETKRKGPWRNASETSPSCLGSGNDTDLNRAVGIRFGSTQSGNPGETWSLELDFYTSARVEGAAAETLHRGATVAQRSIVVSGCPRLAGARFARLRPR